MKKELDPKFVREVERGLREDVERLILLLEEISRSLEIARKDTRPHSGEDSSNETI